MKKILSIALVAGLAVLSSCKMDEDGLKITQKKPNVDYWVKFGDCKDDKNNGYHSTKDKSKFDDFMKTYGKTYEKGEYEKCEVKEASQKAQE